MVLPEMIPTDTDKDTIGPFKKKKFISPMTDPSSKTFRGSNRFLNGSALNEQPIFREELFEGEHDGQYRGGSIGY